MKMSHWICLSAACGLALPALAQDALSPRDQGLYIAPMASYVMPDNDRLLDDSLGGVLGIGYRFNPTWAVELTGNYAELDRDVDGGGSSSMSGGTLSGLLFPSERVRGFFLAFGAGYLTTKEQAAVGEKQNDVEIQAGLGYLLPLSFGDYDFGMRLEGRMRLQQRDGSLDGDDPRGLSDTLVNLGLQLPLGRRPPPPPPEPVVVVPVVLICSDGLDNDGDGLIDFPADPGCTSAEDDDETDPAQCSDGKDNDGDGLVDFPADKGCSAAEDNDEVDPCKTPAAGERVSLKGCGLGDVIVLRGVNFEFDKDRLTVNAKTILDNVAEELTAYPEITIELGGHTDAKGSDEYNQALSDRRAASVVRYLKGKDIAAERMTSAGYGEAQPVADNETDEGRELNRRVELKITSGIAPGSATTTSDGSSTTVTEATTTEPAVEAPAADAPAADAAISEASPAETPVLEEAVSQ